MLLLKHFAVVWLILTMAAPSAIWAQQAHVADDAVLAEALAERSATDREKRQAVTRTLQHPQVRELAEQFGIDIVGAEQAVGTLQGADLDRLAQQAQQVDDALAGGQDRIVISTTTIIIGLLVLILLIVATS